MGKSCGASQSCGSSSSPSGIPIHTSTPKSKGKGKMDTASVDTIDGSKNISPINRPRPGPSACPPGCDAAGPSNRPSPRPSPASSGSRPGTPKSPQSSCDSSGVSKEFMDSLVNFMQQAYNTVKDYKDNKGQETVYCMLDSEKIAKARELMDLIAQKERELSMLEAQRDALGYSTDTSAATTGGGAELSSYWLNMGQSSTEESGACNVSCQAECSPSSYSINAGDNSPYSPGMGNVSSFYRNMGLNSSDEPGSCNASCQSPCSPSSPGNAYSEDMMSPYSPGRASGGYRAPPNTFNYSPEMESSMQDYSCEEECQAECTGDMVGQAFDDRCGAECDDIVGDADIGGYMDFSPQQYSTPRGQKYGGPPQQQYSPQQYASPQYSSPQQFTQSYTQAVPPNTPMRSSMAGKSVSSCYCPTDTPPGRYNNRKR